MTHYRLYFMNPHSGHIERAEHLLARDDGDAISISEALLDGKPMELWRDGRKVTRLEVQPWDPAFRQEAAE